MFYNCAVYKGFLVALSGYTGKASEIPKMENKCLIAVRHPETEFLIDENYSVIP